MSCVRTCVAVAVSALALGVAAAPAGAVAHNYNQELRNVTTVIIVCGHLPGGGCRNFKLLSRTHPGNCTRDSYMLYPRDRRAPARRFITKACG